MEKDLKHIRFNRLRDIVTIPHLPEVLDEVTYIANASNFRRALLNQFGRPDFDPSKEIAEQEDTRMTYNGYCRYLRNDLRYIFHRGENRTGMQYKRDVKYIARQMIIRGDVSFFSSYREPGLTPPGDGRLSRWRSRTPTRTTSGSASTSPRASTRSR